MFKAPTTAADPPGRVARTRVAQPVPPRKHTLGEESIAHLQRTIGNQAVLRILRADAASSQSPLQDQTKLPIDEPGDRFEQEADRIAEQVIRAPASGPAAPALVASVPVVQKKTAGSPGAAPPAVASAIVDNALRSPGQPLDAATRAFMEPRFGRDFSQVRVHTGSSAAVSAKALHARAYTVGSHVAFEGNQFAPATIEGKRLLAHELAHVVQQSSGPTAIQRAPAKDEYEKDVARPARALACAGGAMPYLGVCVTDEILDALPEAAGDVHAAQKKVKANAAEKRAQSAVAGKYAKLTDAALSKKINEMQEEVARGDKPGVIPASLRRLENERNRRRALPISAPTSVDQAIAMLEEAWSLTEMEQPLDLRRAAYLVHVVNNWLQDAAAAPKYDKYFSGMAKTTAMMSVGMAKGNVNDLEHKFRFGATIGGWWPATIDSLKASRELVQIMSGEKRMEETKFNAIGKTINTASWATPAIGAAVLAAPAVIAAGAELIPAGLEAGGWMAARAAPRVALWIGSHPVLAAEIGGSALALGEKISEGDLTPQDVLWTLLTLGHANMQDKSMFRPSTPGPNDFTPKRAPNQVLAAFIRGLNDAEVLPEFSPGTGGGAPNRPIPAVVASAPPAADAPENMPTPLRPNATAVSDVAPDAPIATPVKAPTADASDIPAADLPSGARPAASGAPVVAPPTAPAPATGAARTATPATGAATTAAPAPVAVQTVAAAPTVAPVLVPRVTPVTKPMKRAKARRPTMSSTGTTLTAAKPSNPQVSALPRSSQAFSGDAAASVTPTTPAPAPAIQAPRTPVQSPTLLGENATPSGDTAGTGGIHQIRTNIGSEGSVSVEINGDLRQPIPRRAAPNFNQTLPTGNQIGLQEYEIAHAWGPGFGDEARDGLMYAPRDVNQFFQNRATESRLRELYRLAHQQGGTIHVSVKTTSHPLNTWRGHHLLKTASYHFEVSFPGGRNTTIGEVDINVPLPTAQGAASGQVTVEVTGGSMETWSLR